ncbi:NADH-cytochrome b5 reductase-like isoform X2 [Hyperolius riggenbachi]
MGDTDWSALKPVEPSPAQCCGSGCSPCIYDLYQADLELWEKAKGRGDPRLLSKAKVQSPSVLLNTETFTGFTICSIEKETEDTKRYRFHLPPDASLGLTLGQHLVLRESVNGLDVQRAYTPISPIDAKGYFDVLIKVYDHGLMSQRIKCWREGDTVLWRGPFGGFPYKPNKFGELLLLCSGTGLAPMIPILTYVTDNEDDETFITLVVCFRTLSNVYIRSFLQEEARFWNVRVFYVFSQEKSLEDLPMSYRENAVLGRISSASLQKVLDTCRKKPFVLLCGSASFTEDLTAMLQGLGHSTDSIFSF